MDALEALRSTVPEAENAPDQQTSEAKNDAGRPKAKEPLLVQMERRRGKPATIISGFSCTDAELLKVAARLKTTLGTGGSARGGEILIQGDRREDVARLLRGEGYKVRGA